MEVVQSTRTSNVAVRKKINWYFWGALFVLPEMILFFLFLWMPILKGIVYSFFAIDFFNDKLISSDNFVGFANYASVIHDSLLSISVKNTVYYMVLGVVLGFWIPPLVAISVTELRWFQGPARIIGYLPSAIPAIVLYGMWMWFYDPVGPLNSLFNAFGLAKVEFFSSKMSMISIVLMETWQNFGSATLIYIAALVGIPRDLYEAAEIDGAGVWQRIRHITLPSIKSLLLLLLLLQLISTSQGFQAQLSMTDGGPNNATLTYLLWMIHTAFTDQDYSKASAMGSLMFAVLVVLTMIYNLLQRRSGQS
jgi:multiple sugar transport system permease protein